jgi:hypothetical protein
MKKNFVLIFMVLMVSMIIIPQTVLAQQHDYFPADSPGQYDWSSNTYNELEWTDIVVTQTNTVTDVVINYTWLTDSWPDEGSFHLESPEGTSVTIASGELNGTYSHTLTAFNGQAMNGIWKLWIQDTYGDGGHVASDITVSFHYIGAGYPGAPTNPSPANNAISIATDTGISWTNGADTDNVQVLFGTSNPPTTEVYNGVAVDSLTNVQIDGPLDNATPYYWRVIASNDNTRLTTTGPVWNFTTAWGDNAFQIGYGTVNNSTTGYPAPYGNYYYGSRHQMLIPASELYAAGMTAPGFITSLAFDVVSVGGASLVDFTVKVRNTDVTELTAFITDDLVTVWGPQTYADAVGWNNHPFTTPFFWDGISNLLVETSHHNASYTTNAIFNQTATTGYVSTIVYRADDGYNYDTPTVHTSVQQRPNILFSFDMVDAGSLEGYVYGADTRVPLVGATVDILGSPLSTTTDDTGFYSFATLQAGTYDLTASKFGYHDQTVENIAVAADGTTNQDFTLQPITTVNVTGQVVGSDFPAIGLVGVPVALTGYDNYYTQTAADGYFTIPGVFMNHTYDLTITPDNYSEYNDLVVVEAIDVDLGVIVVNEIAVPPNGVVAAESIDGSQVDVVWNSPGYTPYMFWDFEDGPDGWTTGAIAGNDHWQLGTPAQVNINTAYSGNNAWMTYLDANYENNANTWLMSPELDFSSWAEIHFSVYLNIWTENGWDGMILEASTDGGVSWFHVRADDLALLQFYNSTSTSGPIVPPKWSGQIAGGWAQKVTEIPELAGESSVYLRFRFGSDSSVTYEGIAVDDVYVGPMPPDNTRYANTYDIRDGMRVFESYNVYRFHTDDIDDDLSWTFLSNENDTTYTDVTWTGLPTGTYQYAVKSVHTNDVLSDPAYSNVLERILYGTIEGAVSLTGGTGIVTDVIITLNEMTLNPEVDGSYEITIAPGIYDLTASLAGYQTVTVPGVEVFDNTATTGVDFNLGNIQIAVNPVAINENVVFDTPVTLPLTIINDGAGDLEFEIVVNHIVNTRVQRNYQSTYPTEEQLSRRNPEFNLQAPAVFNTLSDDTDNNRVIFDYLYHFANANAEGEFAVVTDGNYIYTARWNAAFFYRYQLDGTYIDSFTIPGVTGVLDMTYDGEHFFAIAYPGGFSNIVYKLDLTNGILLEQFNTPVGNSIAIAYDANNDGFWVNTGWGSPLVLVSRTGAQLQTLNTAAASIGGLAWDGVTEGGPYLWANTQTGTSLNILQQIDLTTGNILQSFDVGSLGIHIPGGQAGGLQLTNQLVPGLWTFLGAIQNDVIWVLELTEDYAQWLSVDLISGTVPAGESLALDVTLDPTEQDFGAHNAEIIISHNAPGDDVTVPVEMTVYTPDPYITYDPESFDVSLVQGMSVNQELMIHNLNGGAELSFTMSAAERIDWIDFSPSAGVVSIDDSQAVTVTFDASELVPGEYEANIVISHNAQGGNVLIPVNLYVGVPELAVDPVAWDFGDVELMNPAVNDFVLSNEGEVGTVTVTNIAITGVDAAEFAFTAPELPLDIVDMATEIVTVTFTPQSLGLKNASLVLTTSDMRDPVEVPLAGNCVPEVIGQPIGLIAEVHNYQNVELNWGISYGAVEGWMGWNNGIYHDSIGGPDLWDGAVKFGLVDLAAYEGEGFDLTTMRFWPNHTDPGIAEPTYNVRVWTGNDADLGPTTLLVDQAVPAVTFGEWNEIALTTPVAVSGTQPLWVGVLVNGAGSYPLACDPGPMVSGKGGLIQFGAEPWDQLISFGLDNNWLIEAYVEPETRLIGERRLLSEPFVAKRTDTDPRLITLPNASGNTLSVSTNATRSPRALIGYNVYRDNVQLNTEPIPVPNHWDFDLAEGVYDYHVEAVYYSQTSMPSNTVQVEVAFPAPYPLPFTEDWTAGAFDDQDWYHEGNWQINTFGNPDPSAQFNWSPSVTEYSQVLASWTLDTTESSVVNAQFDLYLSNWSTETVESMSFEVFDGTEWQSITTYDNQAGSIPWTTMQHDISAHAANRICKVRFRAHGGNSYNLNNWNIDNIIVEAGEIVLDIPEIAISIVNNTVTLIWDPIENANSYLILVSDDPYAEEAAWIHEATVGTPGYSETAVASRFYRVIASTDEYFGALLNAPEDSVNSSQNLERNR